MRNYWQADRRLAVACGLIVMALCAWTALSMPIADSPVAYAQDEEEGDGDADADDGAADADANQDEGQQDGAADGAGEDGDAKKDGETNTLVWLIGALGWRYTIAFLLLSFFLVALIVMNILGARRDAVVPAQLVEGFEAHLNEKKFQEAYELAKSDDSFLGHVLAAGLARLSSGYPQAIEAMQEVGEEENMKLEHRLSYVALIGSISPMVGLLGTVDGMVQSFIVIANSDSAPKPRTLAEGISTALITTLVGLILAIPAIGFYGIMRNRMQRLVLEVGVLSEGLMSRFQNVGTKKT